MSKDNTVIIKNIVFDNKDVSKLTWLEIDNNKFKNRGRPKWKNSIMAKVVDRHSAIIQRIGELALATLCQTHQSTVNRWTRRGIPFKYWHKIVLAGYCTWDELGIGEESIWDRR